MHKAGRGVGDFVVEPAKGAAAHEGFARTPLSHAEVSVAVQHGSATIHAYTPLTVWCACAAGARKGLLAAGHTEDGLDRKIRRCRLMALLGWCQTLQAACACCSY